jgi:hypothetical protein
MIPRQFALIAAFCSAVFAAPALGQDDRVFIQIEARTSLTGAQQSVRNYAGELDDLNGFALGGGWYGVALGPYLREDAERLLSELRRSGAIPADSYIEQAQAYRQQFWPIGARTLAQPDSTGTAEAAADDATQAAGSAMAEAAAEPAPAASVGAAMPAEELPPEETVREARVSEAALNRAEREELQIALRWAGLYDMAIDAAFGRGTRAAMADWQRANGHEVTGVLTTRQRAALLEQYYAVLEGLGMRLYADDRAGIALELPLDAVAFDRYEAPFVLFEPAGALDARVLLISQPGDRATMNGLYEIMQTLEIVPIEGERSRDRDGFVLTGANDRMVSHTEVTLQGGALKGFTLIWPAGDEARRARVLGLMQASFERRDGVLDPSAITEDVQRVDLVSGLRVRKPVRNASGFFVDRSGIVLTSAEAVAGCARVTLDGVHEVRVASRDAGLGLALLDPVEKLAPRRVAQFGTRSPRLQSEIAVAGYSFGGVLRAPTLTFGTLEDTVKRLAMAAQPGDAGGPVFDVGGAVMGVLQPRERDGAQRLPEKVSFATDAESALAFLRQAGVRPVARGGAGVMAPEDLTALAADTTVLVSCWD